MDSVVDLEGSDPVWVDERESGGEGVGGDGEQGGAATKYGNYVGKEEGGRVNLA